MKIKTTTLLTIIGIILSLGQLSGCGQKGNLYLPLSAQQSTVSE